MHKKSRDIDLIVGSVLLLIAILLFVGSFFIQERSNATAIGPRTMPQVVGIILALTAILIMVDTIRKFHGTPAATTETQKDWRSIVTVTETIVLLIAYVLSLNLLGFPTSSSLYLFLQFVILDVAWKKKIPVYILLSIGVSIIVFIIFRQFFSLSLPTGLIFR
jgi:putative tricarboxylic transport membrane protein